VPYIGGGLVGLAILALWIYCIFDVIATSEPLMRNLPKVLWLLIVIILPAIGSVSWLLLGRPERAGFAPGDSSYRPEPRGGRWAPGPKRTSGVLAPDDDPDFLAQLDERTKRLQEWEDDLKRRDEDLRRREEGEEGE
jgi:hypothetical protein